MHALAPSRIARGGLQILALAAHAHVVEGGASRKLTVADQDAVEQSSDDVVEDRGLLEDDDNAESSPMQEHQDWVASRPRITMSPQATMTPPAPPRTAMTRTRARMKRVVLSWFVPTLDHACTGAEKEDYLDADPGYSEAFPVE